MGKKQQQQQQQQQAAAKAAEDTKPQKKARGHRQKGAGAVITAREPIVRDGVEVQSWQRIPTTLLNEYCQREKRPRPEYHGRSSPPGLSRMSVLVRDSKKADKDLTFTPVQSFDTVAAAKEHAALLALWHLQPTIPLERKLPEPYRTTWLSLLGEASGGEEKNTAEAAKPSAKGKKAGAKEAKQAAAKAPSGGPAQEAPPAATAETKPKKVPVIGLQSTHSFASQADARKAAAEERATKSRKRNWREQYMRANKPITVYMSPKMRRAVENALGIKVPIAATSIGDSVSEPELRRSLARLIGLSVDEKPVQDDLMDVLWPAACNLREMGFSNASVASALGVVAIPSTADDNDEDALGDDQLDDRDNGVGYGSGSARRNERLQTTARHFEARMLEHLMLHTQEEMLPEAFDPRGKGLEVIASSKKKSVGANSSVELAPAERALVRSLQQYGIDEDDALLALAVAKRRSAHRSAEGLRDVVMTVLWQALFASEGGMPLDQTADIAVSDEQELADELEALDSIYPDLVTVERTETMTKIQVTLPSSSDGSAVLDIFIGPQLCYPQLPPLALLRCAAASRRGSLGNIQRALMREAVTHAGQPITFHLISHLDSSLDDYLERLPPVPLSLQPQLFNLLSETDVPPTDHGAITNSDGDLEDRTDVETTSSVSSAQRQPKPKRKKRWAEQGSSFWSPLPTNVLDSLPAPDRSSTQWNRMQAARSSLPAANARAEFLSLLASNSIMLVSGETGCGKTTQIPQYILDDIYGRSRSETSAAKIVVCQPRRLAATGVARRVAEERLEEVGNTVGYMIRGESVTSSQTRLLFCTNGVLLRRLQDDVDLVGVTHVIVDEVHERNLDSDFLMVLLRRLVQRRANFKLILMSATLEQDRFAAYFSQANRACPTIHIPGFTYPVEEFFLDDIRDIFPSKGREISAQNYEDDDEEADASQPRQQQHVFQFDERKLNYYYLTRCVIALLPGTEHSLPPSNGAILVFLPGVPEINRLQQSIQSELDRLHLSNSCWLLPLHGSLTAADQSRVFKVPGAGVTKIVLSTNVAETSITIPDVTVVIDSCRVKQTEFDPATEMPMLVERLAARDSLRQRKGRAGRVQAGRCYRMVTHSTYDTLANHTVPEILRVPLESIVLQLKAMGFKNTMSLLGECVDPPTSEAVAAAEKQLTALQALDERGNLTALGGHLASLPCPAKIGKMLVYACILGCLSPVLSIAAGLTIRSPFLTSSDPSRRNEIDTAKRELAKLGHGSCRSDHLLLARAHDRFAKSSDRRLVCAQLCVSFDRMQELQVNRRQLADALVSVGFLPSLRDADDLESPFNSQHNNRRIIAASLCAGLYPNVIKVIRPPERYHEVSGGAVARDAEAKHMKYFVQDHDAQASTQTQEGHGHPLEDGLSRVWLHPGSINFSEASYNSRWLVYSEKVKTSKVYVRDTTEAPVYAMLLFGGKLEAQYAESTISVDGWIVFSAVGRIVALVNAIRGRLDELLQQKLTDPSAEIHDQQLMEVAITLISSDGLG